MKCVNARHDPTLFLIMKRVFSCLSLCLLSLSVNSAHSDELPKTDDSIVNALRQGGFVIFVRHAKTDWSQKDANLVDYADCKTQRNLSHDGRDQLKVINEAMRRLAIPIGEVLSSQFCRCVETAKIAFGEAKTSVELTGIDGVTDAEVAERRRRTEAMRTMAHKGPVPGTNLVLVSHNIMIYEAFNIRLEEGEAALFKSEAGNAHYVANIKPDEWRQMAQLLGR